MPSFDACRMDHGPRSGEGRRDTERKRCAAHDQTEHAGPTAHRVSVPVRQPRQANRFHPSSSAVRPFSLVNRSSFIRSGRQNLARAAASGSGGSGARPAPRGPRRDTHAPASLGGGDVRFVVFGRRRVLMARNPRRVSVYTKNEVRVGRAEGGVQPFEARDIVRAGDHRVRRPVRPVAPDSAHSSEAEQRRWLIGAADTGVVVVVFTVRAGGAVHRIISARRANRKERQRYEQSKGFPV